MIVHQLWRPNQERTACTPGQSNSRVGVTAFDVRSVGGLRVTVTGLASQVSIRPVEG